MWIIGRRCSSWRRSRKSIWRADALPGPCETSVWTCIRRASGERMLFLHTYIRAYVHTYIHGAPQAPTLSPRAKRAPPAVLAPTPARPSSRPRLLGACDKGKNCLLSVRRFFAKIGRGATGGVAPRPIFAKKRRTDRTQLFIPCRARPPLSARAPRQKHKKGRRRIWKDMLG